MKVIKAEDAKRMSEENLNSVVIEPYLDLVYSKIETACKKGRFSITHPFHKGEEALPLDYPNCEIKRAVFSHLRDNGYEIIEHSNPDPGHPCSSAYNEIKW
jgi:hypothetical protein